MGFKPGCIRQVPCSLYCRPEVYCFLYYLLYYCLKSCRFEKLREKCLARNAESNATSCSHRVLEASVGSLRAGQAWGERPKQQCGNVGGQKVRAAGLNLEREETASKGLSFLEQMLLPGGVCVCHKTKIRAGWGACGGAGNPRSTGETILPKAEAGPHNVPLITLPQCLLSQQS